MCTALRLRSSACVHQGRRRRVLVVPQVVRRRPSAFACGMLSQPAELAAHRSTLRRCLQRSPQTYERNPLGHPAFGLSTFWRAGYMVCS